MRRERRGQEHAGEDSRRHPHARLRPPVHSGPRGSLREPARRAGRRRRAWCTRSSRSARTCPSPRTSASGRCRRAAGCSTATRWRQRAGAMLAEIGTTLDVWRPVGSLTIAQQQMVQIAMAVSGGAKIIIFDEPTSSLSQVEADRLYELIGRLKRTRRGVHLRVASHARSLPAVRHGERAARRPARRHAAHRRAVGARARADDDRASAGRVRAAARGCRRRR